MFFFYRFRFFGGSFCMPIRLCFESNRKCIFYRCCGQITGLLSVNISKSNHDYTTKLQTKRQQICQKITCRALNWLTLALTQVTPNHRKNLLRKQAQTSTEDPHGTQHKGFPTTMLLEWHTNTRPSLCYRGPLRRVPPKQGRVIWIPSPPPPHFPGWFRTDVRQL